MSEGKTKELIADKDVIFFDTDGSMIKDNEAIHAKSNIFVVYRDWLNDPSLFKLEIPLPALESLVRSSEEFQEPKSSASSHHASCVEDIFKRCKQRIDSLDSYKGLFTVFEESITHSTKTFKTQSEVLAVSLLHSFLISRLSEGTQKNSSVSSKIH